MKDLIITFCLQGFTKPEEPEQLSKEALDKWSKEAPFICLSILDVLGSTAVFRVCDLLVIIVKRNGEEFRDKMLRIMLSEVSISFLLKFVFVLWYCYNLTLNHLLCLS